MKSPPSTENTSAPSAADVRSALADIVSSEGFAASGRLTEFLSYVVEETLQGRGELIRAKTIAEAVYGRAADDELASNVVRVDAGRLRRQLGSYYGATGKNDAVRIQVGKGSYTPAFSFTQPHPDFPAEPPLRKVQRSQRPKVLLLTSLAGLATLVGVMGFLAMPTGVPKPDSASDATERAERRAIFEASPSRLQADKLVEQARQLMFPAFDRHRLDAAQVLFQSVVDRIGGHADALAGLAQNQAMIAFLFLSGSEREETLVNALTTVERAMDLEPASAWVRSALAWVQFVRGQQADAFVEIERARRLEPLNDTVQDYQALIYFFSGRFEDTVRVSDPGQDGLAHGLRSPRKNLLGGARFHLGDYEGAAAALASSAESGLPVSAPAFAYFVASVEAAGEHDRAEKFARELMATWPGQKIDKLMAKLLQDPIAAETFAMHLRSAGWHP